MNKKRLSALFVVCIILSGCNLKKPEPQKNNMEIISGISPGMTKEEVFEIYGNNYSYNEEFTDYKNTVEYVYDIDKVDIFDIDMKTQMFFEFEDDEKLVYYGYHIGRIGDYYDSSFPYSKNELVETYDKIYEKLVGLYGSNSDTEVTDDTGIIKENLWKTKQGSIWFIVGVNMWAIDEPVSYEKGVNEIVLSCSVL